MDPRWSAMRASQAERDRCDLASLTIADHGRLLAAACETVDAVLRSRPDGERVRAGQEPRSEAVERFWREWLRRSREARHADAR